MSMLKDINRFVMHCELDLSIKDSKKFNDKDDSVDENLIELGKSSGAADAAFAATQIASKDLDFENLILPI